PPRRPRSSAPARHDAPAGRADDRGRRGVTGRSDRRRPRSGGGGMTEVLTPGLRRRLEGVEGRYEELERAVSAPENTSDRHRIREVGQELSSLAPIVETIRSLRDAERRLAEAQHLAEGEDADMRGLALAEGAELSSKTQELIARLRSQLVPRDPLDEKNVIVEI